MNPTETSEVSAVALARRLLVTACAVTRTTDCVARKTGARLFLPKVFVERFANLGGIDQNVLSEQFDGARSFSDDRWVAYWKRIAAEHAEAADQTLKELATLVEVSSLRVESLLCSDSHAAVDRLSRLVAPAAYFLGDRGAQPPVDQLESFVRLNAAGDPTYAEHLRLAAIVVDSLVKTATYYAIAAWPGWSPDRMRAYEDSRRISEALVRAIAPALGLTIETIDIEIDGDVANGYAVFPPGERALPAVLATNGLDGTAQELLFPLLKYRDMGLVLVVMEMPGTYRYRQPMSGKSALIYDAMIEYLSRDRRVDGDRIGMLGLSFGGYWSTRMAAIGSRLHCVVTCSTPTHRSFGPAGAIGIPAVMLSAMQRTLGASNLRALGPKLAALSLQDSFDGITIPMLIIAGGADSVVDPRDSTDLADAVPHAVIRMYEGDDHCAMGHYAEWMDCAFEWFRDNLSPAKPS